MNHTAIIQEIEDQIKMLKQVQQSTNSESRKVECSTRIATLINSQQKLTRGRVIAELRSDKLKQNHIPVATRLNMPEFL